MSLAPAYVASLKPDCSSIGHRRFKIASTAAEFEAIHRLNHATFAVEIPQHPRTPDGRLVPRQHHPRSERGAEPCDQGLLRRF